MRFPKYKLYDRMQPPKHEVVSSSHATLSDLADKYVTDQMLLNFSRKYGAGAELVVVMQKELRNKFNEKYFEKVHCAFTGHPKWNMITGLDFSKK